MEAKLTLKLDKDAIDEAKHYAKKMNMSLSRIVEKYFNSLSHQKKDKGIEYSPLVKELSGIIHLKEDTNLNEVYAEYLIQKYR